MQATSLFPTLLSSLASAERNRACVGECLCVCVCVCVYVGGWVGAFVCLCVHVCVCVWGGGGGSGKEIVEEGETQLHSERGENEERGETCRRNHCI